MAFFRDELGRPECHRCHDRGRRTLAVVQVPAKKEGYVYYMCPAHFRTWYWNRLKRARREAERRRAARRGGHEGRA